MLLQTENISKSFGSRKVLDGVSLSIDKGSLIGIVGENGSGKSTLLKILVGLWKPDSGSVKINGDYGYCPQESLVFPHLSVIENLEYFSAAYGFQPDNKHLDIKHSWDELFDHFNFGEYRNKRVNQLSGGTAQKLNLSISLLHKPDLLILDEPYSGFDWETYQKFWDYTLHYKEKGFSILMVTHFITEKSYFDNILQLKNGQLK